jgi:ArsR family transcriptional regulator
MAVRRQQVEVADAVQVYAALGHSLRLGAVMFLASRPRGGAYVCEVATHVRRAQSTVSHHLKVLVDAGLLTVENHGSWSWYRLVPARFLEFGEHLSWLSTTAPALRVGVADRT